MTDDTIQPPPAAPTSDAVTAPVPAPAPTPTPESALPETPPPASATTTPSAPVSSPTAPPAASGAREKAAKGRAKIQAKKRAKLERIMAEVVKKGAVTNDDVEKLLHVSDATATRYLVQLVNDGRLTRVGSTGKHVRYLKN